MNRKWIIVSCLLLVTLVLVNGHPRVINEPEAAQWETRCGWFSNPTPANISLYDSEDEWIIGVQGGHQVENDWDWPKFARRQWIVTNASSYGYGCACLQLRVDRQTNHVLEIKSARGRLLSACRQDRSLRRWRSLFK